MHKPLTREHISAIDRRRAAIHEAGHVVMARHIGLTNVSAWLEEMPDSADDILYEKLWIGHTTYLQSGIIGKKLSDKKLAMFAVAGAVSECCWQRNLYDETLDYALALRPRTSAAPSIGPSGSGFQQPDTHSAAAAPGPPSP